MRAAAKVVAALPVNRPDGLRQIEDLHIWTAESVRADRLDFRPKHKLAVLVVSAIPLVEPVRLARTPEYAGCTSWVQLPVRAERWRRRCTTTADASRGRRPGPRRRRLTRRRATGSSSRESPKCTEWVAGFGCRPVSTGSSVPRLRA